MSDAGRVSLMAAGLEIPPHLVHAITFLKGEQDGLAWLEALDTVLRGFERRWQLRYAAIAEGGAMSCCAYCIGPDGQELVLKVPVEPRAGVAEAATLTDWADLDVAPRIAAVDARSGVFLMERLRPGTPFQGITSLDEVRPFIELFDRLHGSGAAFTRTDVAQIGNLIDDRLDWAYQRFAAPESAHLRPNLDLARRLAGKLAGSGDGVLVHGDLQAKNLLWGPRQKPYCIDPLARVGDPISDVAMWAVLQDTEVPIGPLLEVLGQELGMEHARLADWAYVIASAELRPAQPARYRRQRQYLDEFESTRYAGKRWPHPTCPR